jgi:hypothetical protein
MKWHLSKPPEHELFKISQITETEKKLVLAGPTAADRWERGRGHSSTTVVERESWTCSGSGNWELKLGTLVTGSPCKVQFFKILEPKSLVVLKQYSLKFLKSDCNIKIIFYFRDILW